MGGCPCRRRPRDPWAAERLLHQTHEHLLRALVAYLRGRADLEAAYRRAGVDPVAQREEAIEDLDRQTEAF